MAEVGRIDFTRLSLKRAHRLHWQRPRNTSQAHFFFAAFLRAALRGCLRAGAFARVRAPALRTGLADFFPRDDLAADFFAPGFLAPAFFAADFLAPGLFAADFLATDFLATDFLATDFFAADFLAADFLAPDFFAPDFFAPDFLAAGFAPADLVAIVDFPLLAALGFALGVVAPD
jgi:hypothetical protein